MATEKGETVVVIDGAGPENGEIEIVIDGAGPENGEIVVIIDDETVQEEYEWRLIDVFTFLGIMANPSWNADAGNYSCIGGMTYTTATRVRLVALSGAWYVGTVKHWRGTIDVKTQVDFQHVHDDYGYDGSFYGFLSQQDAAAHWETSQDLDMNVGEDGIIAWGGKAANSGNLGSVSFELWGWFPK